MSSRPEGMSYVCRLLVENKQKIHKALDLGCGAGKYGVLMRSYLETSLLERKKIIDGLDTYTILIGDRSIFYDKIIDANMLDVEIRDYDLILFSHALEHITKEEGVNLLLRLLKYNKYLIIVTPNGYIQQEHAEGGNIHESHLSGWKKKDFLSLGFYVKNERGVLIAFTKNLLNYDYSIKCRIRRKIIPLSLRRAFLRFIENFGI